MTVWSLVLIGSLTEQERKEIQGHECGPDGLFRDRHDPGVVWCSRCGACLGSPGGVRDHVPLESCRACLGSPGGVRDHVPLESCHTKINGSLA